MASLVARILLFECRWDARECGYERAYGVAYELRGSAEADGERYLHSY